MTTAITQQDDAPMRLLAGMDLAQVDTDKVEKLMELQERWEARQAEKAFNSALAGFQFDMPQIHKGRRENQGKYHFASYDDIMRVARPVLQKHGLAISFSQEESADSIKVVCRIAHKDGHATETPFTLPKDGPIQTRDGRNVTSKAQAQGSANSYAKRYCLCNALDIVVTDEDDDGQAAMTECLSDAQVAEIESLLANCDDLTVQDNLLKWAGADSVAMIPAQKFREAIKGLKHKIK